MQLKCLLFILMALIIAPRKSNVKAASTEQEICMETRKQEHQCGTYCYKIIRPLLQYVMQLNEDIKRKDLLLETEKEINAKLQNEVAQLKLKMAENLYKDDLIKSYNETINLQNMALRALKIQNVDTNIINHIDANVKLIKREFINLSVPKCDDYMTTIRNQKEQIEKLELNAKMLTSKLSHCQNLLNSKNIVTHEAIRMKDTKETKELPSSCVPFGRSTQKHMIQLDDEDPFLVICDGLTAGPGWTVIERRFNGFIDFNRSWNDYKRGFGSLEGEFFIGLERLYLMTNDQPHELYIQLSSTSGAISYARYDYFLIGNESEKYMVKSVGNVSGNAVDKMSKLVGNKFSTFDADNYNVDGNSAARFQGGWWYRTDFETSCNYHGKYFKSSHWSCGPPFKATKLLIRPKSMSKLEA